MATVPTRHVPVGVPDTERVPAGLLESLRRSEADLADGDGFAMLADPTVNCHAEVRRPPG